MSIEITHRRLFEGPNIYYPQGGVAARLHASHDVSAALVTTLKTWAQAVGLIIGYLRVIPTPQSAGVTYEVRFTCNHPLLGLAMLDHVVADLQAAERGDDEWSHDDQLFDLRRRRIREDPPLALLQIRAEAQGRGLPVLSVGDGTLQIGTGTHGWRFDPAQLSLGMAVTPPWQSITIVPLIVVSGRDSVTVAEQLARSLDRGTGLVLVRDGTGAALKAAMLDPQSECIVAALNSADALEHGLVFNRCQVAIIGALHDLSEDEALAAGLPALVTDETGMVVMRGDDAGSVALAERIAAQPVIVPHIPSLVDPLYAQIVDVVRNCW